MQYKNVRWLVRLLYLDFWVLRKCFFEATNNQLFRQLLPCRKRDLDRSHALLFRNRCANEAEATSYFGFERAHDTDIQRLANSRGVR